LKRSLGGSGLGDADALLDGDALVVGGGVLGGGLVVGGGVVIVVEGGLLPPAPTGVLSLAGLSYGYTSQATPEVPSEAVPIGPSNPLGPLGSRLSSGLCLRL
jgi:hypothetical protein